MNINCLILLSTTIVGLGTMAVLPGLAKLSELLMSGRLVPTAKAAMESVAGFAHRTLLAVAGWFEQYMGEE